MRIIVSSVPSASLREEKRSPSMRGSFFQNHMENQLNPRNLWLFSFITAPEVSVR